MDICNNIKVTRIKKGMSKAEVAKRLNIPYTSYQNFENRTEPKVDMIKRIATVLDVSISELIEDSVLSFQYSFGNKVKNYRQDRNFTQKELAEKTGLAEITIRKIENGLIDPRKSTIQKIAKALEINISELMDFESHEQSIGDNIKKIRKSKGMLQKDLANKIGVSEARVAHYEQNYRNPTIATLKKIADALEVDVKQLYGEKQDEPMFTNDELQFMNKLLFNDIEFLTDEINHLSSLPNAKKPFIETLKNSLEPYERLLAKIKQYLGEEVE